MNSVGYLPKADKQALIASPCSNFTVLRLPESSVVFKGNTGGPILSDDTGERLYTADFSQVTEPGKYRVEVPGLGSSPVFQIGKDVYREPLYAAMRAFYLWRCGTAVSAKYQGHVFSHGPCHTNDGLLNYVGQKGARKDGTQGWHDAGDYNKYIVNAGIAVGTLLRAWEDFNPLLRTVRLDIPESGGPLPDYLAEVKWEMDWVLKMQAPDGSAYHKLTTLRFGPFIPAEAEKDERYFASWGSEATAHFAGMTAQAARVFKPYDPVYAQRCVEAAQRAHTFLNAHPEYHRAEQSAFRTGPYEIRDEIHEASHRLNGVPNNRLWAEAELWETTGSPEVLGELEAHIRAIQGRVNFAFDWDEVKDLGLIEYEASHREGRDAALVALVRSNILAVADQIVQTSRSHAYGSPMGAHYSWGYNGFVARQTLVLAAADRLARAAGEKQLSPSANANAATPYRAVCLEALNHLFGRNYYGRSFVTGVGCYPPLHPHDRRCANGAAAWPGYLVGGPQPTASAWKDIQADAGTNEIAINWNAALVYALAVGLEDATD